MTRIAGRAAEEHPLQVCAVAYDVTAGGATIPADEPSMQRDVGVPG